MDYPLFYVDIFNPTDYVAIGVATTMKVTRAANSACHLR